MPSPIETIGIVLTVVGLAFAFEKPRRWFLGLFKKAPEIRQDFKVRTLFHAHNNGKPLGPLGTNKTDKKYVFEWTITNQTPDVLQIERGIVMRQAAQGMPTLVLAVPEFTYEPNIFPGHTLQLLSIELTPGQVEHYRHWVRECNAFGARLNGKDHWIATKEFAAFGVALQTVAKDFGLPDAVPEGKMVSIKIERKV